VAGAAEGLVAVDLEGLADGGLVVLEGLLGLFEGLDFEKK